MYSTGAEKLLIPLFLLPFADVRRQIDAADRLVLCISEL